MREVQYELGPPHLATSCQRPEVSGDSVPITTRGRPLRRKSTPFSKGWLGSTQSTEAGHSLLAVVTFSSRWLVLWHGESLLMVVAKFYFERMKKCGVCMKGMVGDSMGAGASQPGF